MKVLEAPHYFFPHGGGIEFFAFRMARDLVQSGASCEVATSSKSRGSAGSDSFGGIPVHYLPSRYVLPRNPAVFGLRRLLRSYEPDVVHIHSIWFIVGLQLAMFKRRHGYRLVNSVHGASPTEAGLLVRVFIACFKPMARYILRRSDIVIVYDAAERERLLRIGGVDPGRIRMIPNGIDAPEPDPERVGELRASLGPFVLFTGRIIPDKNPDALLKAFARLEQDFPDLSLVYVGPIDDEYQRELEALGTSFGDRLHFLGPIDVSTSAGELASLYDAAEVSLSIGSWEGMPTRILESMSVGTPVIAFNSGSVSNIVVTGHSGTLVQSLEPEVLEMALRGMLTLDSVQRKRMRAAAIEVTRDYMWPECFARISREFTEATDS